MIRKILGSLAILFGIYQIAETIWWGQYLVTQAQYYIASYGFIGYLGIAWGGDAVIVFGSGVLMYWGYRQFVKKTQVYDY